MSDSLVDSKMSGECVTRNGVTKIARIRATQCGDTVVVGFVSRQLKRSLHAGFSTTVTEMDEFCMAWLKARAGVHPLNAATHALQDIIGMAQKISSQACEVNRLIKQIR